MLLHIKGSFTLNVKESNSGSVDSPKWDKEKIFFSFETYHQNLLKKIQESKRSIDLEVYHLGNDNYGKKILDSLKIAANRNVKVRLIVDGVGTLHWDEFIVFKNHFEFKVFNPLPWPLSKHHIQLSKLFKFFLNANKRSHKKLCIIDKEVVFIGSMNLAKVHVEWKDISVLIQTKQTDELQKSFDYSWIKSTQLSRIKAPAASLKNPNLIEKYKLKQNKSPEILVNYSFNLRKNRKKILLKLINSTQKKLWIVTPYFIPSNSIIKSLCQKSKNGTDVRLVLSYLSDVPFFPAVSRIFYKKLTQSGIKIYEYKESLLHSKCMLLDKNILIGSSNLNTRSLRHDLELDIVLNKPESYDQIENKINEYFKSSQLVDKNNLEKISLFKYLWGHFLSLFRHWI